jgi:hypothetical protein
MKSVRTLAGLAAATFAASLFCAAPAAAQAPTACWDYTTISKTVGGRFGIKGSADDTIVSRTAYYNVNALPVKISAPLSGQRGSAIKVELRSDAEGAKAPLKLTGLLVDVSSVDFPNDAKGVKYETHASDDKSYMALQVIPLEARFKAGDTTLTVPLGAMRERNIRSAKMAVRLGAYAPATWVQGKKTEFDPAATLPQVHAIYDAWKSAGAMTIEFVEPQSGAVAAVSDPIAYFGAEAEAEFTRANGRAREMLRGGKCHFLED